MGGLILDYWGFDDADYGPAEFNKIYVPSMNNGQHDANAFIPLARNFG